MAKKTTKPVPSLRGPQIRLLKVLKRGKPLTRAKLSKAAKVDGAMCTSYLGKVRVTTPGRIKSLLDLKLVTVRQEDVDGKDVLLYAITAKGKETLSSLK